MFVSTFFTLYIFVLYDFIFEPVITPAWFSHELNKLSSSCLFLYLYGSHKFFSFLEVLFNNGKEI